MRTRILSGVGAAVMLAVLATGSVTAAGQPNASCEDAGVMPPGFGSGGFAIAEDQYAGNGSPSLNANSPHAVSQYDVACYQLSIH